jgi:non-ribosomal peptide synthetase component F
VFLDPWLEPNGRIFEGQEALDARLLWRRNHRIQKHQVRDAVMLSLRRRAFTMGITGMQAVWETETEGLELLNMTIGDLLDQQAQRYSDHEALVYHYPERGLQLRLTYRQYRDEANRLARGLLAQGIQKGEHVAIWAPNVPAWALLQEGFPKCQT